MFLSLSPSSFIFFVALFFTSLQSTAAQKCGCDFFVELTRFRGTTDSYALICKTSAANGRALVLSLLPAKLPKAQDTIGRDLAVVRCLRKQRDLFTRLCNQLSPADFIRDVQNPLDRCVKRPKLNAKEKKNTARFRYTSRNCRSAVKGASPGGTEQPNVSWICECKIDDFVETVPNFALYGIQEDKPSAQQKEFAFMKRCSKQFAPLMQNLCKNRPGDYLVQGLQYLQTCCKRYLDTTVNEKFRCEGVVPPDLTNLKDEF